MISERLHEKLCDMVRGLPPLVDDGDLLEDLRIQRWPVLGSPKQQSYMNQIVAFIRHPFIRDIIDLELQIGVQRLRRGREV